MAQQSSSLDVFAAIVGIILLAMLLLAGLDEGTNESIQRTVPGESIVWSRCLHNVGH